MRIGRAMLGVLWRGAVAIAPVAVMVLLLAILGSPQQAVAHAVLMDSSPKAGQMLESSPQEVSATFNESVGPIFFKILDRAGKEVGKPGEIQLDGLRMVMPLGEALPKGTYVLTYRVISADTHPVGTTFGFSIGEPMTDTAAMAASADAGKSAWTTAVAINRWALYAAMLLAAGSALFVLLLNAPAPIVAATLRVGRLAAIVGAIAYLLAIGVGGAEMVLGGGGALFAADTWARGLASTLTPSAAIGVPAMLLLFWAFSRPADRLNSGALGAGVAAAIGSFLVTGHAATAPPVWLMATAVGVHLVCTSFWMGSLYPLYKSTQLAAVRDSGALMTQFSKWAVYAVAAIVASGALISWTQLDSPRNLLGNDYGTSLIRKLVLFALVIGIAAYNKIALTPALERGEGSAAARIRRSIRIEYVAYVLILGAAMSLTLSIPPRAMVAQGQATGSLSGAPGAMASEGVKQSLQSSGYTAELDLTPARAGENMLMVTVKDANGQVLTNLADLEIVAALESAGIQEIRLKGQKLDNGMWHVMIAEMLIPGEWSLGVEAFVTDFDKVEFATKVQIQ